MSDHDFKGAGGAASGAGQIEAQIEIRAAVLTVSDRCSRGEADDTAGPAVAARLREFMNATIEIAELVPDERATIAEKLRHYADAMNVHLAVAVGGTGFAPRDVTPEAVCDVIERATPGLDEAMRGASLKLTPHAILSRAVSGMRGGTLILSLPGSLRGALDNLEAILAALPHGIKKLRGDPTACAAYAAQQKK